ncbi:MAG: hypothetical protein NT062_36920 [Proteobacteria bacterium]|nr:hypothetical protein [Pseudomonadota bacterium]
MERRPPAHSSQDLPRGLGPAQRAFLSNHLAVERLFHHWHRSPDEIDGMCRSLRAGRELRTAKIELAEFVGWLKKSAASQEGLRPRRNHIIVDVTEVPHTPLVRFAEEMLMEPPGSQDFSLMLRAMYHLLTATLHASNRGDASLGFVLARFLFRIRAWSLPRPIEMALAEVAEDPTKAIPGPRLQKGLYEVTSLARCQAAIIARQANWKKATVADEEEVFARALASMVKSGPGASDAAGLLGNRYGIRVATMKAELSSSYTVGASR